MMKIRHFKYDAQLATDNDWENWPGGDSFWTYGLTDLDFELLPGDSVFCLLCKAHDNAHYSNCRHRPRKCAMVEILAHRKHGLQHGYWLMSPLDGVSRTIKHGTCMGTLVMDFKFDPKYRGLDLDGLYIHSRNLALAQINS
jgi:hypothetical protein